MKQVVYNGGTQSYYGCSDPAILVVGQTYEVIHEEDRGWQTNYTLRGVKGQFNSVWFEDVNPMVTSKPTYFAFSKNIPVVGKRYSVQKLNSHNQLDSWSTSAVLSAVLIGDNTYKVVTRNSIYLVQVN